MNRFTLKLVQRALVHFEMYRARRVHASGRLEKRGRAVDHGQVRPVLGRVLHVTPALFFLSIIFRDMKMRNYKNDGTSSIYNCYVTHTYLYLCTNKFLSELTL